MKKNDITDFKIGTIVSLKNIEKIPEASKSPTNKFIVCNVMEKTDALDDNYIIVKDYYTNKRLVNEKKHYLPYFFTVDEVEIIESSPLNKALEAIGEYLRYNGWESASYPDFNWIDPVTKQKHRSDFAFFIQSERESMNYFANEAI